MNKNKTPKSNKSVIDLLLDKASKHIDNKQKYIKKAEKAKGNEVFKYLLLLTCIECEGYVTEIQLQAHRSFDYSIRAALFGLILVSMSVGVGLYAHLAPGAQSLEIAYISGVAGIISQVISALFFWIYKESLKRMDASHKQLREIQMITTSLFLTGLISKSDQSDERKKLIDQLMSHSNLMSKSNQGYAESKDLPIPSKPSQSTKTNEPRKNRSISSNDILPQEIGRALPV